MTIHSLTNKPPGNNPLPPKATQNEALKSDKKASKEAEPTVNVAITDIAKKITEAFETSPNEVPGVDNNRVLAIKAALDDGTYPINAEVIAEKMIQMEQEQFFDS